MCCTVFLYSTVQTVHCTQTLELYTTEQLYACVLCSCTQPLKKQTITQDITAPTDRGEGSYSPVLQRSGKALKLSSSHSPPKRLSPGGYLYKRNPCMVPHGAIQNGKQNYFPAIQQKQTYSIGIWRTQNNPLYPSD